METTIKQAEEERTKALQESKRILKDYQPMKDQINKLRDMLSLEKIQDTEDDEAALMTLQYVALRQHAEPLQLSRPCRLISQQTNEHETSTATRSAHLSSTASDNLHDQHHSLVAPFLHQAQQMTTSGSTGPISTSTSVSSNTQSQAAGVNVAKVLGAMASTVDRSAFRQQPPPMKVISSSLAHSHTQ